MSKRNTAIDFAKGATIILMLWAHIRSDSQWINSFHMPLFFILSGYFIKDEPLKVTFVKKVKGLLIPYIIMELIYLSATLIFDKITQPELMWSDTTWILPVVKERLMGTLLANSFCVSWFIWVLFGSTLVYAVINKLRPKLPWLYGILIAACSVAGYFFGTEWLRTPYRWDLILFVVPFVAVGHIAKLCQPKLTPVVKWVLFYASLLIWIVDIGFIIMFDKEFAIALCIYGLYPLTVLGAMAGTDVVVTLCGFLDKIPVLNTVIRWFGRNTLVIIAFAVVATNVMEWYGDKYTGSEWLTFVIQLAMVSVLIGLWIGVKKLASLIKGSATQSG